MLHQLKNKLKKQLCLVLSFCPPLFLHDGDGNAQKGVPDEGGAG